MSISIENYRGNTPPKFTPSQKAFAMDEELTVMIENVCKHLNFNSDDYFADRMTASQNASIRKAVEALLEITSAAELEKLYIRLDAIRELS